METSDVGKWLQRDVNCLADPQRSVRKRSLEKLSMVAELSAKFGQGHLVSFFQSHLFQPLVACFADPIEKNRELSIRTCTEYAKLGAIAGDGREKALVVAIHARIGKAPFPEGAEELRLQLLELLALVLHGAMPDDSIFTTAIGDVMETLAKTATDPFPDAKKACCDAILVLAAKWPAQVKMHLAALARPLTMNLGHQHARVRLCTLQALETLVPCGSTTLPELMKDVLLPNLSRVMFDRSAAVRKQLVQAMATWCLRIDELREFEAALLPLLFSGLADESEEVQRHSLLLVQQLSTLWASDPLNAESDVDDADMANVVTPPFTARPPLGARLVTRRLLAQLLPSLLDQCSDWTVQTREKATSILRIVLLLVEDAADAHVAAILSALAKTCRDDEPVVVASVQAAMAIVGQFANPDLIFSSLLPLAAGRLPGQDTSHHRTNGLVLLSMAIAGMAQPTILPHMERITEALADAGLREADAPELQEKLSLLTATIVATGAPLLVAHEAWAFRLFWVLSQMIASTPDDSIAFDTAIHGLVALATALELDVPGLYRRFLTPLVQTIGANDVVWSKASPHRVLFDSMARRGGKACGAALPVLLPVLLRHLDPAREADVRLAFLALLETMLGNPEMAPAFQPFASTVLVKAITPNIVWQGGKVAATIRKVAMACTYTLLRQGLATTPCLFEAAPVMLPVLKAALDDGDAKTRQLVCLALQFLFVALPQALGQEPVAQLYHDLLKRLDDSNDLVRKAACATFLEFLRAAPPSHFQGTIIDYSMDALFVHLDDNDSEIQAAVFAVLLETKRVDATRLRQKAAENRSRLRSPYYCDQLLQ
ncbi:hypothetical protein SPRG_19895 [Saprolegnia parasitica CBS 223.65]|uniref:TOG domain-containing protein n=1 Tax=Saprolegnia parasitica (strain CBS 223.65) TaxID=695850 RepID=A0A067CJ88_SAPPC|nr:hypothetical protein SPRG_19895 [Saprolegnia parasitica CBS 223.65]KDO29225.1 hypothetical protein SPRG_19895 [Saprolegnia parasitica CBS 223.65]|eukprot:XP_012200122.1 hypothetical protein SPRG_19895 [Saprolegnia parasitica CBS 223.65]